MTQHESRWDTFALNLENVIYYGDTVVQVVLKALYSTGHLLRRRTAKMSGRPLLVLGMSRWPPLMLH